MLAAEILLIHQLRKHNKPPKIKPLFSNLGQIGPTLKQSRAYLLTDNGLDVLLNMDLFVLGLFVTSRDLGVYAEATVMARFFLIIPVGMRIILRRHYTLLAEQKGMTFYSATRFFYLPCTGFWPWWSCFTFRACWIFFSN